MQPWLAECLVSAASDHADHADHGLLAAAYSTKTDNLAAPVGLDSADATSVDAEIHRELNVDRLAKIERHWWLIGRPQPPRPLHRQVAMGRCLVVDERMDMHLVWTTGRIFVKPLPRFVLCDRFWDRHLTCQDPTCSCLAPTPVSLSPNNTASTRAGLLAPSRSNREKSRPPRSTCLRGANRRLALGFLVSYLALIRHESDFLIAREARLVPDELTWPAWHALARRVLDTSSAHTEGEIYQHVDRRFVYGDLRLSRLNKVYRFSLREPLRGYVYGDQRYVDFWRRNLGTLTSTLAYMVIVLTAMQVGLATTQLGGSVAFGRASSGFAAFCILAPLVTLVVLLVYFVFLFVNNWRSTTAYGRKRERAIWPSV